MSIFWLNVLAPMAIGFICGAVAGRSWLVLNDEKED